MATLFLALQCVECSTMQVKQQKKSSNRWVCLVCNQRQSVLRVHTCGYRAADFRRFVQGANLSRGRGAPVPEAEWGPAAVGDQQDEPPRVKRRMDWTEYLEFEMKGLQGCNLICHEFGCYWSKSYNITYARTSMTNSQVPCTMTCI